MAGMSQYALKQQGGGAGTTAMDFRTTLAKMVAELKPGGSIERASLADIDKEGKLLGAQLNASAVSRGLGNASTGIPTTVFKQVSSAKQKLRADTSSAYLGALTNLAQLAFQQEQADADRALQAQRTSNASQGLDAFGKPMSGTLAAAELDLANRQIQSVANPRPSAQALPSLYAAGGYGVGGYAEVPSLFGESTAPAASSRIAWDQPIYGAPSGRAASGNAYRMR